MSSFILMFLFTRIRKFGKDVNEANYLLKVPIDVLNLSKIFLIKATMKLTLSLARKVVEADNGRSHQPPRPSASFYAVQGGMTIYKYNSNQSSRGSRRKLRRVPVCGNIKREN